MLAVRFSVWLHFTVLQQSAGTPGAALSDVTGRAACALFSWLSPLVLASPLCVLCRAGARACGGTGGAQRRPAGEDDQLL